RAWLKNIQQRKPSIWVIVDTCNAGTMIRGADDEEVLRGIHADQLIPNEALDKARQQAAKHAVKAREPAENVRLHFEDTAPDLVAIYAVRSGEFAWELPMPRPKGTPDAKSHGLLTYTLVEVLTQA